MNDVAIIGVGLHPFGRFDKTAMEMGADAIQYALTDAGVQWKDIQFGFGGSYEVSNPDAVTRLVGLTGIERYLTEGNSPDQPGRLVAWLHEQVPVYGYRFEGEWFDIGDKEQLLVADNRLRARAGLPQRAEYAPE